MIVHRLLLVARHGGRHVVHSVFMQSGGEVLDRDGLVEDVDDNGAYHRQRLLFQPHRSEEGQSEANAFVDLDAHQRCDLHSEEQFLG